MKGTKLTVKFTSAFKRDFKLAMKRNRKIQLLENIVAMLANGETLPPENRDHELTGNWVGHRECHIQPDWLLIYRIDDALLLEIIESTGRLKEMLIAEQAS